jgi:hypothetical protein
MGEGFPGDGMVGGDGLYELFSFFVQAGKR